MATDTTAADTPAPDYPTVKRARGPYINAETRIAPTCMIWCVGIGIGLLVLIVLVWAISNIGSIFR